MHDFKPRGIVKWSPFAALYEYQVAVSELTEQLNHESNIRSSHYLEFLDFELRQINDEQVVVNYYFNNQVKSVTGIITNVLNDEIEIADMKIKKEDIADIIR